MTTELGPAARALLDAARRGMSPDAAATRRVRAKIAAAVGRDAVAATMFEAGAQGVQELNDSLLTQVASAAIASVSSRPCHRTRMYAGVTKGSQSS